MPSFHARYFLEYMLNTEAPPFVIERPSSALAADVAAAPLWYVAEVKGTPTDESVVLLALAPF